MDSRLTRMKNPAHPGEILREDCIEPMGLSITEVADALGVARKSLSALVNGKAGMALRLSLAFGTTPEFWLNMQQAYDLAQAVKAMRKMKVKRLAA